MEASATSDETLTGVLDHLKPHTIALLHLLYNRCPPLAPPPPYAKWVGIARTQMEASATSDETLTGVLDHLKPHTIALLHLLYNRCPPLAPPPPYAKWVGIARAQLHLRARRVAARRGSGAGRSSRVVGSQVNLDSFLEGGVNRAKLKFTNINTTTSRVSVRNINKSAREGAKQIVSK
jgi:hypothetical protein